jgi:phosphate transport system substrate-binding protein
VGWDDLAVIVHPQNPVMTLSMADLQAIFSGQVSDWSEMGDHKRIGKLETWIYPSGEDVQQVFLSLFGGQAMQNSRAWLAPDPQSMRIAVSSALSAIGYLPRRWADSSVKVLDLTGVQGTTLRRPILALSHREPQGAQRLWLECINTR